MRQHWWPLQQEYIPRGTRPARAYGADIELVVEFSPGHANGEAKTTARRLVRKFGFGAGVPHASAIAGFVEHATATGVDFEIAAKLDGGLASAAAATEVKVINCAARFKPAVPRASAEAIGADLEWRHRLNVGSASARANACGAITEMGIGFVVGKASGSFRFDVAEINNDLLMLAA